jgi:hypothetical protein
VKVKFREKKQTCNVVAVLIISTRRTTANVVAVQIISKRLQVAHFGSRLG